MVLSFFIAFMLYFTPRELAGNARDLAGNARDLAGTARKPLLAVPRSYDIRSPKAPDCLYVPA